MRRPGRLTGIVAFATGAVAVSALTLVGSPGATSAPRRPGPLATGAVTLTGLPEGRADGWRVTHPDVGRYVLELPAGTGDVDVTSWDAVSDVTVAPHGDGVFDVIFGRGSQRLDTRFRFVARQR